MLRGHRRRSRSHARPVPQPGGEGFRGQSGVGAAFELEIAETIGAANQAGRDRRPAGLLHARRGVAYREADARRIRRVRAGGMRRQAVVERRLARRQADVDDRGLVNLHGDLLAAGQHVVVSLVLEVAQPGAMAAARIAHAAVLRRGRREGDPGGEHLHRLEAPVVDILVPGDPLLRMRGLDEEIRAQDQKILSQDGGDGAGEPRIAHE